PTVVPDGPSPSRWPIREPISPVQPAAATYAAKAHAARLVLSTKSTLGDARSDAFPFGPTHFRSNAANGALRFLTRAASSLTPREEHNDPIGVATGRSEGHDRASMEFVDDSGLRSFARMQRFERPG